MGTFEKERARLFRLVEISRSAHLGGLMIGSDVLQKINLNVKSKPYLRSRGGGGEKDCPSGLNSMQIAFFLLKNFLISFLFLEVQ